MGEKWFPLAKKSVSTSKNNVIFQKLDFPVSISRKKITNEKRYGFKRYKIGFH